MKAKLILEYRGDDYCGFQNQPGLSTVQGELENALKILFSGEYKKSGKLDPITVSVSGSGRTDSGVHALAQVVSFIMPADLEIPPTRLQSALNGILPPGIAIRSTTFLDDNFDARRSANDKCYRYNILLRKTKPVLDFNRAWCVSPKIDIGSMIKAAQLFVGEHDFENFHALDTDVKTSVRIISRSELCRISQCELQYFVCGQGFLKQMVRRIVGALVAVGEGKLTPSDVHDLLTLNKSRAQLHIETAPAYGLYLKEVFYT
ncbi:MAG: tRNA pseudouridine(38-40) synthase TruA [Deltaproteobacteria bacterium]|nr:tRNA pseudouridine(38-40) synthase TruA [Deltaproteobacteria bacterium]